jgi:DNA-binding NtrC family response regulator
MGEQAQRFTCENRVFCRTHKAPLEITVDNKMNIMIGSSDNAIWERFTNITESKNLALKPFRSIKQARKALAREDVLLIFCENRLIDGTYEDLLAAAKSVRSKARIVVTGLESDQFDSLGYCKARELGAFDVLRKSFGIKDLEWVVICAIRDQKGVRTVGARHSHN